MTICRACKEEFKPLYGYCVGCEGDGEEELPDAKSLPEQVHILQDQVRTLEEMFDELWGLVYPGKTDWEYPGQVFSHLKIRLQELEGE